MACSKLEARGHLLHKTGTHPKHFSRECITLYSVLSSLNVAILIKLRTTYYSFLIRRVQVGFMTNLAVKKTKEEEKSNLSKRFYGGFYDHLYNIVIKKGQ